jgi:hypothetical protein
MACEPRAYAARTCIVGRRSKPEIAKPISQFAQITRRMAQRLDRVERIGQAVPASGLRHELCNARSALWTHSTGIETAFLPDHASEKFNRESVLRRRTVPASGKRRRLWVDSQPGAAVQWAQSVDRPRDAPPPEGWCPPAHSFARLPRREHRPTAVRPIEPCRSNVQRDIRCRRVRAAWRVNPYARTGSWSTQPPLPRRSQKSGNRRKDNGFSSRLSRVRGSRVLGLDALSCPLVLQNEPNVPGRPAWSRGESLIACTYLHPQLGRQVLRLGGRNKRGSHERSRSATWRRGSSSRRCSPRRASPYSSRPNDMPTSLERSFRNCHISPAICCTTHTRLFSCVSTGSHESALGIPISINFRF